LFSAIRPQLISLDLQKVIEFMADPHPTDDSSVSAPVSSTPSSEGESTTASGPTAGPRSSSSGPINLETIRRMRQSQEQNATPRPDGKARRGGPKPNNGPRADASQKTTDSAPTDANAIDPSAVIDAEALEPRYRSNKDSQPAAAPKVPVPSSRQRDAIEDSELEDALLGADLDRLMIGDKNVRAGVGLEVGNRYQARILKVHNANVFVSLGGPNEGVIPLLQFTDMPTEGQVVDVVIRSFNAEEGLYELAIPGEAITANDWSDLEEGAVVEAKIESANTGGVECKVGSVRGFIPISQLSEFRIESAADFIGQKLLCVVTEANPRRGNLVLSHRAVLEREKKQKREERLATLEIGQQFEGVVRKVMDFGAFVDIGGLDGLIHVSQLSWEKIKHPSEVIKEGDKVQVRIEKFDPKTAKISLSYRSLQDDPWTDVDARFPVGSTVTGAVTRLANFGAFVRLGTGIEGLIHISELAHRRVTSVSQILAEGQEVEVKILTVDRESQRIGLSLKATQAQPESNKPQAAPQPEEVRRESAVRKFQGELRGGTGSNGAGDLFGLKL
jgi:predicted RNA-binding protein with RPS1 domain